MRTSRVLVALTILCGAGGDAGWTLLSRAERASVASAALRNCSAGAIPVETCCAGIEALLAEVRSCVVNRRASGLRVGVITRSFLTSLVVDGLLNSPTARGLPPFIL